MTQILIVDSERPVRNTLCRLLENRGYGCVLAANGDEARRYICEQPFDLIISDIVFPHESGIEFVRFALSSAQRTAVIILTGIDDPQVAEKILQDGAADYILKPVQEATILVAVTNSIRRLEREAANVSARKDMEHRLVERITQMQQTIHHLEQTQKALQESEARYRELVEGANSVILRIDPTGRITFINAFGTMFFGYEHAEILGRNIIGTIIPESEGTRDAALKTMVEDILEHPHRYCVNENENIRKNGERVWVAWTNRGIYDKDGRLLEILSIGNDITRRKQAEEKSRLLASVLEQAEEAVLITDTGGTIQYVNRAFERISGYLADEVAGRNPRILKSGEYDRDFYEKMWQALTGGQVWESRFINKRRDGSLYEIKATISPVKNAEGRITHYVGVQKMVS